LASGPDGDDRRETHQEGEAPRRKAAGEHTVRARHPAHRRPHANGYDEQQKQKKDDDKHERHAPHHSDAITGARVGSNSRQTADRENPVTGRTD
jgi:hypothetical protein